MTYNKEQLGQISLSSLALLSIRRESGKDYLDYLEGFVAAFLNQHDSTPFDAPMAASWILQEYGLKIPESTYSIYLKRLVKSKILQHTASGVQYEKTANVSFMKPVTKVMLPRKEIELLTESLAEYAYRGYSNNWDTARATTAMINFVADYSTDLIRHTESNSPLPTPSKKTASDTYIVSSFLQKKAHEKSPLFETALKLVQSHILSNALLCPDLVTVQKGFSNTNFIIDTRFAIQLLDLESKVKQKSASNLISSIQRLKGCVCIFPDTVDEIKKVITAVRRGLEKNSPRSGPIQRELLNRKRNITDLTIILEKFGTILKDFNISTITPPFTTQVSTPFKLTKIF